MRRTVFFVTVAAVVALVSLWLMPRHPRGVLPRPASPTAEEEGGPPVRLEPGVRLAPHVQVPIIPRMADERETASAPHQALGSPNRDAAAGAGAAQDSTVGQARPSAPTRSARQLQIEGAEGDGASIRQDASSGGDAQGGRPSPVSVITAPVLLTHGGADYPAEGYRVVLDRDALTLQVRINAAEGRVVLKVFVQSDGSVGRIDVAESSGTLLLDQAALRAASTWTFAPATRDGQPVDAWAVIPVRFMVR